MLENAFFSLNINITLSDYGYKVLKLIFKNFGSRSFELF